ncbi:MAG: bifunctional phosphopantothenoylcysteine decarboxylase/phosphopantothenate--cysteine ligase CoaBC [Bdellovibrionales bacterium]|nr:bifunctional phosphopantothenoylcysteine decarboxylase/phosphopantothenate--cysteine ligase CoaBC [Bdellovibrionales bacterium]
MSKSKILVIMTGSIACYKACQIVSRLVQSGHEVQVVTTKSALNFVGPATLEGLSGRKVLCDMYEVGQMMGHIHWARWADLILVAPATANFINKIAHGLADDLASTLFLSHDFKRPFLIAPAMNSSMYSHPVTQGSLKRLQELGVQVLETASGVLACGEEGYGKLLDPELIEKEVAQHLSNIPNIEMMPKSITHKNQNIRILITAGGTSERIDDIRVISNRSTGATGVQLSQKFSGCGFPVTLLLSESSPFSSSLHDFEVIKFSDYESLKIFFTMSSPIETTVTFFI